MPQNIYKLAELLAVTTNNKQQHNPGLLDALDREAFNTLITDDY